MIIAISKRFFFFYYLGKVFVCSLELSLILLKDVFLLKLSVFFQFFLELYLIFNSLPIYEITSP